MKFKSLLLIATLSIRFEIFTFFEPIALQTLKNLIICIEAGGNQWRNEEAINKCICFKQNKKELKIYARLEQLNV